MAAKKKNSHAPATKTPAAKPKKAAKPRPEAQIDIPPAAEPMPATETANAQAPAAEAPATEAAPVPDLSCKNCKARTTDLRASGYCSEWCEQEAAGPAQPRDPQPTDAAEVPAAATPAPPAEPATVETTAPKKLSAIDAAARVLAEAQPMNCQELIAAMSAKGYWTSPGGKTPASTLYSAILRELKVKGDQARFVKAERGKFAHRG